MWQPSADYKLYRAQIEGEPLARSLYRAVIVLFVINSGFIGVDFVVYPAQFWEFLPVRIGLDSILAFLCVATVRRYPVSSTLATSAAGGWMLFTVTYGTGGASSDYYVGLVLLLIGIGVLVPLSARQGALAISSLCIAYIGLTLVGGRIDWQRSALSFFFLSAAAFIGMMSCAYLDRMRFADFLQRREIEKARDELQQLDEAKSRFTSNVHHELRTPLTLLLAPVEALLAGQFGEVSDTQRGYLQTIRSNALRLLKLINNLLDLAKAESQQLRVQRRPLQLGGLVEEIVAGAAPLAERKRVVIERRGLDELPLIHADPDALEKVVVNLLGNALKFTDAGGRISVEGWEEDEGGIHLQISDTGVGIPAEQLDHIFDRFAQVDAGATRRFEGTGIGLALVKELVELHGGRVYAESDGPGMGSRMHVVLPVGESDTDAADAVQQSLLGEISPRAGSSLAAMEAELDLEQTEAVQVRGEIRLTELEQHVDRREKSTASDGAVPEPATGESAAEVLVVEDNPDMRRLLADLVGQEFRVRTARNGREGLERVRESAPDVVLTDVMMPEMSGVELCAAIKGDAATAGIPVVLVTSKAEREMKIEGLERGADDYITKPFHPRELMARVRSLTRLRRLQSELAVRNALLQSTNEELQSTLLELREAGAQLVQAERLAAVGELAAGVAHEVNNPINFALNAMKALRGTLQDVQVLAERVAALAGLEPERLRDEVREIETLRRDLGFDQSVEALGELGEIVTEGLERTSRLVGDLRDFAAPGGRGAGPVDVARSLRSTLQLVRHVFVQAGVEIEEVIPTDLPTLEGDSRAINQVFLNLLKNAAEAFEGRHGRVAVRARLEGDGIVVEIQDDGPGIAPEVRARLFEPFFSTKPAGRGSGLGLSISQRIVSEHGGRIDLESSPDAGTCARVWLPLRSAAEGQVDATQA
jgi:signal transduction histidine kinase